MNAPQSCVWREEPSHFLAFLVSFSVSFSCTFSACAPLMLKATERSYVLLFCCLLSMIPLFSSLAVSVGPLDATDLETRRAASILACIDVVSLRMLYSRYPITTRRRTPRIIFISFLFYPLDTGSSAQLLYLAFRLLLLDFFFVCTSWIIWTFIPRREVRKPSASRLFFFVLFSVVFSLRRCFRSARASRSPCYD